MAVPSVSFQGETWGDPRDFSPIFHAPFILVSQSRSMLAPAMKNDNIDTTNESATTSTRTIAIRLPRISAGQVRLWASRALMATGWLAILGLLAGGAALGVFGLLVLVVFGSEAVFAVCLTGAALSGAIGTVLLVRQLNEAARSLREDTARSVAS